jgi:DNA polymerase III psi subunit
MNIQTIFENNTVYKVDYVEFTDSEALQKSLCIKGNVNSELIVFYRTEDENALSEELSVMLSNMMKAVKINMDNVLMVDVKYPLNFSNIHSITSFAKCIVFGVSLKHLGLQITSQPYTIMNFNGVEFLFAESLHIINGDKQRKVALWQLLQKFFNINA